MTTQTRTKLKIVDADGHYMEPADMRPWVEGKYKDVAPHRVVDEDGNLQWGGRDWWTEGMPKAGNVVFRRSEEARKGLVVGNRDAVDPMNPRQSPSNHDEMPVQVNDPVARLQMMDEEQFDAAVLYPSMALSWYPDPELHLAVNRGLNNWLADWCSADTGRLMGATNVIAIHDVEAAIDEVKRCYHEHNFRAVFVRTTLAKPEDKWHGEQYDPFWAVCEDLGISVGMHPFVGDSMYGSGRYFDVVGPTADLMYMRTPFNPVVDAMHAMMGLITGGVNERFPNLHFAILEASGGWAAPFLERLESRFEYMGHTLPHLKMTPLEYFQRNWWISFDPEEAMLRPSAEYYGADRIIWGSDYPHPDAFYPGFVTMLNENIDGMSHDDQERIRGLNAVDFYRLGG